MMAQTPLRPLMRKSNVGRKKCRETLPEEILQRGIDSSAPAGDFTTAAYNDECHANDDEDQSVRVSFQVHTRGWGRSESGDQRVARRLDGSGRKSCTLPSAINNFVVDPCCDR